MKLSKTEMRRLNKLEGYHFFDGDTISFFESEIETKPSNPDFLFITSEIKGPRTKERGYTVRQFNPKTFSVDTVSDFNRYNTLEEAKKSIDKWRERVEKFDNLRHLKAYI